MTLLMLGGGGNIKGPLAGAVVMLAEAVVANRLAGTTLVKS